MEIGREEIEMCQKGNKKCHNGTFVTLLRCNVQDMTVMTQLCLVLHFLVIILICRLISLILISHY